MKEYLRIEEFPIAERSIRALKLAGFRMENDFEHVTERELLGVKGFGPTGLAELKLFLKGRNTKLLRIKKEKKLNHPRARDLIRDMLLQKPTPKEIKLANKLLEHYTYEELTSIEMKKQVASLSYFCAGIGSWLDTLVHKITAPKLLRDDIEEFKRREILDIVPEPEKIRAVPPPRPIDLKDWLKTK